MGRWVVMGFVAAAVVIGVVMSLNLQRQIQENEHLDQIDVSDIKSLREIPFDTWQGVCLDPEKADRCFARARAPFSASENGAWVALVISREDPSLRLEVFRKSAGAKNVPMESVRLRVDDREILALENCQLDSCYTESASEISALGLELEKVAGDSDSDLTLVAIMQGGGERSADLHLHGFVPAFNGVMRTPAK